MNSNKKERDIMQTNQSINNNDNQSMQPKLSGVKRYKKYRSHHDTLFGKLYSGVDVVTGQWVAIKESNKWFARNRLDLRNNPVSEDLFHEIKVMKYLMQQQDLPKTILKLLDVVEDQINIYLILEWVAGDFFNFIKVHHQKLQTIQKTLTDNDNDSKMDDNNININVSVSNIMKNWEVKMREKFYETVSGIKWLHFKNICHLDISLENTLIDSNGNIRIIDFGVSQYFGNGSFIINGRSMGKSRCMSPEVWYKREFDARLADTWSIGIMLFMVLTGVPLWEFPDESSRFYNIIKAGKMRFAMVYNNQKSISKEALDLLIRIFKPETERIYLDQVLKHPFCSY
eukprot:296177_1